MNNQISDVKGLLSKISSSTENKTNDPNFNDALGILKSSNLDINDYLILNNTNNK